MGKLLSRRHPQRFPRSPVGARFRIRDRAAVGCDAAQPADLEDTVGWKVANPLLQDELRRIGEFGAHGLRIAGIAVHPEQHLLETPALPPPGLPVHGGFVRNYGDSAQNYRPYLSALSPQFRIQRVVIRLLVPPRL